MKKYTWLLVAALFFVLVAPAFSAPLFGDVPDEHWARDAVANLAAKGLVEGYPDGTFKGDRAATRYEMAMVIAASWPRTIRSTLHLPPRQTLRSSESSSCSSKMS